jgi:hypothetical protein
MVSCVEDVIVHVPSLFSARSSAIGAVKTIKTFFFANVAREDILLRIGPNTRNFGQAPRSDWHRNNAILIARERSVRGGDMRPMLFILLAGAFATGASAQTRPLSTTMSCAQASSLVNSSGGIVLSTSAYAYDRYVSSGRFCGTSEMTEPAWIATRDTQQCFVGYRCRGLAQRQSGG